MPLYEYKCQDCNHKIELFQSHEAMKEFRELGVRCARCEGRLQWVFPVPAVSTDTTFVANWGDGFGEHESRDREMAKRVAKRAGVSTNGATYCPGLCAPGKPKDPAAWVPHDNAKSYIKKRCEELNYSCEEFGIKSREPVNDPLDKPYTVAPDLVERQVDKIVEREYEGKVDKKKRAALTEATAEKLAGNMNQ